MATKQTTKSVSGVTIGTPIGNVQPKTVAAVILLVLMGLLWARVLLRSGPETALADSSQGSIDAAQQESRVSEIQIRPVVLAEIPGRHDVVADDFFRADRCSAWQQEKTVVSASTKQTDQQRLTEELIKAVALEAIIKDTQGIAEKACINGVIVTAGSVLQIPVRNEAQSVRVMTIEPGRVRLNWRDHSIDIEMPDQKVN